MEHYNGRSPKEKMITIATSTLLKTLVFLGEIAGLLSFRFSADTMCVSQYPTICKFNTLKIKKDTVCPKLWKCCLLALISWSLFELHIHFSKSVSINVILVAFHEFQIVMGILMLSNLTTVTKNKYDFCSLVNEFLATGQKHNKGIAGSGHIVFARVNRI